MCYLLVKPVETEFAQQLWATLYKCLGCGFARVLWQASVIPRKHARFGDTHQANNWSVVTNYFTEGEVAGLGACKASGAVSVLLWEWQ
jgi:hypothetical protein